MSIIQCKRLKLTKQTLDKRNKRFNDEFRVFIRIVLCDRVGLNISHTHLMQLQIA